LYKTKAITLWKQAPTNASMLEPMQIDSLRFKELSQKEKEQQYKEDVCLYCGGKNYQVQDCPIKASTLKLYKVRNVSTSIQLKVDDAELEKKISSHSRDHAAGESCTIFNQWSHSYFRSFSLFYCPTYNKNGF
jgi:hypothetical protein